MGQKTRCSPSGGPLPKFTPVASPGATRAFLSAQMPSGLIVNDMRLMRGKNGYWIALPSMKMMNRAGQPLLDAKRRPLYRPIVEFKDRTTRNRFIELVLALARAAHPEVFADDDAP